MDDGFVGTACRLWHSWSAWQKPEYDPCIKTLNQTRKCYDCNLRQTYLRLSSLGDAW